MEYQESTMETRVFCILFVGYVLAPTTNKYCDFDATLVCSVMEDNATSLHSLVQWNLSITTT